jgi:hypothetical protein
MSIAAASPLWAIDAGVSVTAVLDRIALTASAMRQDGRDRDYLACVVGVGTVPAVKQ